MNQSTPTPRTVKIEYGKYVAKTVFPDATYIDHTPSIKPEQLVEIVLKWRQETNTF